MTMLSLEKCVLSTSMPAHLGVFILKLLSLCPLQVNKKVYSSLVASVAIYIGFMYINMNTHSKPSPR